MTIFNFTAREVKILSFDIEASSPEDAVLKAMRLVEDTNAEHAGVKAPHDIEVRPLELHTVPCEVDDQPTRHETTVDEDAGDRLDTGKAAAFCDTDGCDWRAEWHHNDTGDENSTAHRDAAVLDGLEHERETVG